MSQNIPLRAKILDLLDELFASHKNFYNTAILRSALLQEANDIDLFSATEEIRPFLAAFEAALFDRYELESRYDFSHNEVIKIDIIDHISQEREHLDVWYQRTFKLSTGTYTLTRLDGSLKKAGHITPEIEAGIYLLHLIDRGNPGPKVRRKLEEYLVRITDQTVREQIREYMGTETLSEASLKKVTGKLLETGLLEPSSKKSSKRAHRKPFRRGRNVIAVLGADGVGKTTSIHRIKEELESRHPNIRVVWDKFRRIYHRSFFFRKARNLSRIFLKNEEEKAAAENRYAFYTALFKLPFFIRLIRRGKIVFIDRYIIDLAIDRKSTPLSVNDRLLRRSYRAAAPDGIILIRASGETVHRRKGEMSPESVESYYRYLFDWSFRSRVSYIISFSTESTDVTQSTVETIRFIEEKLID